LPTLLEEIERDLVDTFLPTVPRELRTEAARAFMNVLGDELWTGLDLATYTEADQ
jgi:hypothetical protein